MENKVIFESEEHFDQWWYYCGIGEKGCHDYKIIKYRTKEQGYMRKSAVEEAEEVYKEWEQCDHAENTDFKLITKLYKAIQEQKKEITELEQDKVELEKLSILRWKIISELQQENKYLCDQNKAFQEQYCTSGDIIRKLRQEKAELVECLKKNNIAMSELLEVHSCFDLEKALMPVYANNTELIERLTRNT